jgi:hypothetical protein
VPYRDKKVVGVFVRFRAPASAWPHSAALTASLQSVNISGAVGV